MRAMLLALALDPRLLGEEEVEPREAIALAVEEAGRPDLHDELVRICMRESWCGRYGEVRAHEGDAWAGRKMWTGAVRKGWLDPGGCEEHMPPSTRAGWSRWSTRGALGMSAAYHLHRLEPYLGACLAPEVLDHPGVSAWTGVLFMEDACERLDACTCETRTRLWVGAGNWDRRTHARRRESLARQCGPQKPLPGFALLADMALLVWRWAVPWDQASRLDMVAVARAFDRRGA